MFAKSGREAMDIFAKHRPSLVITDWMMPDFRDSSYAKTSGNNFKNRTRTSFILTGMTTRAKL